MWLLYGAIGSTKNASSETISNEKEKRMKSETTNNSPLQLQSLPEDSTVEVCSLQQLSTALTLPSREWINRSPEGLDMIQVCKISQAN